MTRRADVRVHDGDRELKEGDVLGFPRGAEGGYQIGNESDEVARVLILSTHADPDVAEYDSGKVGIVQGSTVQHAVRLRRPISVGSRVVLEHWPQTTDHTPGGAAFGRR